jgi:hypothetical protein
LKTIFANFHQRATKPSMRRWYVEKKKSARTTSIERCLDLTGKRYFFNIGLVLYPLDWLRLEYLLVSNKKQKAGAVVCSLVLDRSSEWTHGNVNIDRSDHSFSLFSIPGL